MFSISRDMEYLKQGESQRMSPIQQRHPSRQDITHCLFKTCNVGYASCYDSYVHMQLILSSPILWEDLGAENALNSHILASLETNQVQLLALLTCGLGLSSLDVLKHAFKSLL